jgi:hypothetical protein
VNHSRRSIIGVALVLALSNILLGPPIAAADEPSSISSIAVVAASVDLATHEPVVVVRITCTADVGWIRAHFSLVQHTAMPYRAAWAWDPPGRIFVYSDKHLDFVPVTCPKGSAVDLPVRFPLERGVFSPGLATIEGWIASYLPAGDQTLSATNVLLHPVP